MLAVMDRQNSQTSSIASERITTVVAVDEDKHRRSVNLEDADKHEQRIRSAVEHARQKVAELISSAPADLNLWSEQDKSKLADLKKAMKHIEAQQGRLKADMVEARKERRQRLAEQRESAMEVQMPKAAPPVRMEELRAMNMKQLDESDLRARYELAQKPRPIIPSGGFTGFRVAPDLKRMDFSHSDPNNPDRLEAWRPENAAKAQK